MAANMFTAATQLIALKWKVTEPHMLEELTSKIWQVFLLNKLSTINKYYAGQSLAVKRFQKQWFPFIEYVSNIYDSNLINQHMLEML